MTIFDKLVKRIPNFIDTYKVSECFHFLCDSIVACDDLIGTCFICNKIIWFTTIQCYEQLHEIKCYDYYMKIHTILLRLLPQLKYLRSGSYTYVLLHRKVFKHKRIHVMNLYDYKSHINNTYIIFIL